MAWQMQGRYMASCSCTNVCPCSTASAPPDNPDGSGVCYGLAVFDIREGNLDGTSLAGVRWAFYNEFPGVVTDGNWKVGLVVDSAASAAQAKAVEEIVSGKQGGPFADFAPLIAEFIGVERQQIRVGGTEGAVGGTRFSYEPLRGADGTPTTMKNAAFGFAPEFEIGKSTGRVQIFGRSFVASYGEAAEYTYSSAAPDVRLRA